MQSLIATIQLFVNHLNFIQCEVMLELITLVDLLLKERLKNTFIWLHVKILKTSLPVSYEHLRVSQFFASTLDSS